MDIPVKYIQNTEDCHYERPMTLGTITEDGEDLCRAPQKYRQMCKYCIRDKDHDGKIEEICQLPSEYKSNCNFTPRYGEEGKVDVPPEHQTEKPDDTVNMCLYAPVLECPYVKRGHLDEAVCAAKGHEKETCGYDSSVACTMGVCAKCEHYPADRLARERNRLEDDNWCWLDQRIRCFRCHVMGCKNCKRFPEKGMEEKIK